MGKLRMTYEEQYALIAPCLSSDSLKQEIARRSHIFSESDLLVIAYRYSKNYDERIRLLRVIEENFSAAVSDWAKLLGGWQQSVLAAFCMQMAGTVYELHVKARPGDCDTTCLCQTWDAVLAMIPKFYMEFEETETSESRCRIVKRKILTGSSTELFEDDVVGECTMLSGGVIKDVKMYALHCERAVCSGLCMECQSVCADAYELLFPNFAGNGCLVRYANEDGDISYGISFCNQPEELSSDLYVIPLTCDSIRLKAYAETFCEHCHVALPLAERISLEELPENLRGDYNDYMEYWRNHEL